MIIKKEVIALPFRIKLSSINGIYIHKLATDYLIFILVVQEIIKIYKEDTKMIPIIEIVIDNVERFFMHSLSELSNEFLILRLCY